MTMEGQPAATRSLIGTRVSLAAAEQAGCLRIASSFRCDFRYFPPRVRPACTIDASDGLTAGQSVSTG